ncbi:MAG: hypothetical protein L0H26_00135 [Microlunatus sp.]|nr:hypothetical protein [Microlunatus sp.]
MSWQVTVAEFDRWEEKIRRLNRRAAKRGFTGQVHLSGERAVVVNDGRFAHLPRGVEVVVVNAEITGEPPCYGSWRFLAALDALPAEDGGIGWVIRYAPGAEERGIDRTVLRARWCDHCRTERVNRRHLYAVEHLETGEIMQVGSTCIKDFLGHSTGPVVLSTTEVEEQLERFGGWRDAFTPRTVVAAALATVGVAGGGRAPWPEKPTARRPPISSRTTSRVRVSPRAGPAPCWTR